MLDELQNEFLATPLPARTEPDADLQIGNVSMKHLNNEPVYAAVAQCPVQGRKRGHCP
jgi:hypothetical protein